VRRAVDVLRTEGLAGLRRGYGIAVREQPERAALNSPARIHRHLTDTDARGTRRVRHGEGVPVFSVTAPHASVEIYPADRWQLLWPS